MKRHVTPPTGLVSSRAARRGLVLLMASSALAGAQDSSRTVQPERPTVATHAGTVAPGYLEIETGAEFDKYPGDIRGTLVPTVFKLGVTRRTQLSVFAPVVGPPDRQSLAVGDLAVGLKWRLLDDAPLLGRFAVLPTLKFPTGASSSGAGTGTTDVGLLLISSHDVGPVALDINAGYTRRNGDGTRVPRDATVWTVSTGGPAWSSFGWVAEVFGFPRTSGPAGQASTVAALFGPTIVIRPWYAMDAGVIVPITGSQPHAIYAGAVWNTGRLF